MKFVDDDDDDDSKKNLKEPLWHSNNVWVRVPKQVSLQFTSKHWQRWSRCDVFRETVPDAGANRSKWAVSKMVAISSFSINSSSTHI